jgi:hypothetical protein
MLGLNNEGGERLHPSNINGYDNLPLGNESLSFTIWWNGNRLSARTWRTSMCPGKFRFYHSAHTPPPPPGNLLEGSLLVLIFFPHSFFLSSPFSSKLLPQPYVSLPVTSFVTSALNVGTACFSETLTSTCETTWRQNARQHQHHTNRRENTKSHYEPSHSTCGSQIA